MTEERSGRGRERKGGDCDRSVVRLVREESSDASVKQACAERVRWKRGAIEIAARRAGKRVSSTQSSVAVSRA